MAGRCPLSVSVSLSAVRAALVCAIMFSYRIMSHYVVVFAALGSLPDWAGRRHGVPSAPQFPHAAVLFHASIPFNVIHRVRVLRRFAISASVFVFENAVTLSSALQPGSQPSRI